MNIIQNLFSSIIIILALGTKNPNSEMSNSSSPSLVCSDALDCETCVRDSACFWCESKLLCKVYDASKKEVETKECGELMWKNCKKPENPGVAHVISAVVSVLLIIGRYQYYYKEPSRNPISNRMKQQPVHIFLIITTYAIKLNSN